MKNCKNPFPFPARYCIMIIWIIIIGEICKESMVSHKIDIRTRKGCRKQNGGILFEEQMSNHHCGDPTESGQ